MDNTSLTLMIALVVGAVLSAYYYWRRQSYRRMADNPASLDELLMHLQRSKEKIERALVRRQIPLEQLETATKMQENLLEMIRRLQLEDRLDSLSLNSAMYIATEIEQIIDRQPIEEGQTHHCYFCSRPYRGAKFLAKVRQRGSESQVVSCGVCMETIRNGGRAKVLHFKGTDGRSIHWSEYKDFLPNSSYWNINNTTETSSPKLGHLALVKDDDDIN